jgi:hypothetical protein
LQKIHGQFKKNEDFGLHKMLSLFESSLHYLRHIYGTLRTVAPAYCKIPQSIRPNVTLAVAVDGFPADKHCSTVLNKIFGSSEYVTEIKGLQNFDKCHFSLYSTVLWRMKNAAVLAFFN